MRGGTGDIFKMLLCGLSSCLGLIKPMTMPVSGATRTGHFSMTTVTSEGVRRLELIQLGIGQRVARRDSNKEQEHQSLAV